MKKLIFSCIGTACLLALSSCDTVEYDDDDDDGGRRIHSTTQVTEETVRTHPYSGTVERQTIQSVY